MSRVRTVLVALAPFLLHAVAREADRALGLVLRAELAPRALPVELARALAVEGGWSVARVAVWVVAGGVAWLLLALVRARAGRTGLGPALVREAPLFAPFYLRPAITLAALVAVVLRPSYPYGFTLPVALTQDWGVGQDAAALAVLLAMRLPVPRLPGPRAGAVFLISFLLYAVLVPGWAWVWDGHPGNEPKYLRQAVALGHGLTFDAAGVSAAMEELPTEPAGRALSRAAVTLVRESGRMIAALTRGEAGRHAIRATRITRQTIRGKEGGVYYVLAPGPSILLAPALRIDRALNLARGTNGRLAVSVLLFCLLAALLVATVFCLVRDATRRPGLAAALALGFAFVPPFVFYFFQFYPEMPGALLLAFASGTLALRPERLARHPWLFGWAIALLPWLHQKFVPVWAALAGTALVVAWRQRAARGPQAGGRRAWRVLMALAVPQAASLYLTALYNFAITGSARPDALFLAWGPGGVTSARVGQGLLGLLLDARYGILPYVPVFIVGIAAFGRRDARPLLVVLPCALAYYLTVASADNWAGAVCNLGRYVMPLAALGVVLVGVALAGRSDRPISRGAVALALMLAAWTALITLALWRDPHAANDSALLLAKGQYADGNQYIPNLFIRHWSDGAPGLWARIAAWVLAAALVALGLRRAVSPLRTLVGAAVAILALSLLLEHWPARRAGPSFANALPADLGLLFLQGAADVQGGEVIAGPGRVEIVRRRYSGPGTAAAESEPSLRVTIGGSGILRAAGLPPLALRPTGAVVDLPLMAYHVVYGGDGRAAVFSRLSATVSGQAVMRFGGDEVPVLSPAGSSPPASDADAEPDRPRLR